MAHFPLLILCSVPWIAAQEPLIEGPEPSLAREAPAAWFLDWGVGVVGSEVITASEIQRAEEDPSGPFAERLRSGEDRKTIRPEVLRELAMTSLEIGAGKRRGFDPTLVESLVDGHFQRQVERFGGAGGFSQRLQTWRMSPDEFRKEVTNDLYRIAWRDSERGSSAGPSGRIKADRFVRPGELLSTYDACCESLDAAELALVGARPAGVRIERMILDLAEHAPGLSGQQALDRVLIVAEELRKQVASGQASFEDLLGAWDANRGRNASFERDLGQLRVMARTFHGDDGLLTFARSAQPGDLSPPLVYTSEQGPRAVMIYALRERTAAVPPEPFLSLAVQQRLRAHLVGEIDERRLVRAHLELVATSNLFPAELRTFLAEGELREAGSSR